METVKVRFKGHCCRSSMHARYRTALACRTGDRRGAGRVNRTTGSLKGVPSWVPFLLAILLIVAMMALAAHMAMLEMRS